MNKRQHALILAGGDGKRLWPLSKKDFPKQFLRFGNRDSLLQETVRRCSNFPSIVVSTNAAMEGLVREQLQGFDVHILVEPCRKNTGPAIGLGVRWIEERFGDEPILVLPSDHLIEGTFSEALGYGMAAAVEKIVAFGIRPTKPETGYGYIRMGEAWNRHCFEVDAFIEKPELERAIGFVQDTRYLWNSGMYAFTPSVFWEQAEEHYPEICQFSDFEDLTDISIDYALMEHVRGMLVCPLPVVWSDIGSWESVYTMMPKDTNQNAKTGHVIDIGTKNCLILGGKRVISTLGVEDLVIIDTDEAILIAKKSDAEKVREIADAYTNR
jgi:mannose-1-phosphate guanylyltransferase/mannose-6-phosphate isomerase